MSKAISAVQQIVSQTTLTPGLQELLEFNHQLNLIWATRELDNRLELIETFIDEQKAKPGVKDPIRSALHTHLDQLLNFADIDNPEATAANKAISAQIHKFFRELMK